jgi:EmrB/QacA subfamily drug resistance transporter
MRFTDTAARRLSLAILCASQFLLVMDFAIVNVALPSIRESLGFSETGLTWVASAYALTFGGFLLVAGRLADVFGRRRTYIAGTVLFTTASAVCGLADSPGSLVAARAIQGVGAALAAAPVLALITTITRPGRERGRAFALWGAMAGLGAATGLVVGGALTAFAGWPAIFFINVPVGVVIVSGALSVLPADAPARRARVGVLSAVTATAAIASLIYAMSQAAHGWQTPDVLVPLAVSAVMGGLFSVAEVYGPQPLVPWSVLRQSGGAAANLAALPIGGATAAYFFTSPYMQDGLGYSAWLTGLAYLCVPGGMVAGAAVAGRVAGRVPAWRTVLIGSLAITAGLLILSRLTLDSWYVTGLLPGLTLLGFGRGVSAAPLAGAAMEGVEASQAGVASGIVNTSLQLGAAMGVAAFAAVGAHASDAATAGGALPVDALVSGVRAALGATAVTGVMAAIVAITLMRPRAGATSRLEPNASASR